MYFKQYFLHLVIQKLSEKLINKLKGISNSKIVEFIEIIDQLLIEQ